MLRDKNLLILSASVLIVFSVLVSGIIISETIAQQRQ